MRLLDPPPRPAGVPPPPAPPPLSSPGTGSRLWLVRHAEVGAAWRERAYGAGDVPLSARGLEQTAELAGRFGRLSLCRVYSSDLPRARTLAETVAAAAGAPLVELPALREIDRGSWSGWPLSEYERAWHADAAAYWRDPWRWRAHGGESDADLFERAFPALERAARETEGGTSVLATHGNWIRVVLGRALGVDAIESYRYRVPVARASLLADTRAGWRLEAFAAQGP